MKEDTSRRKKKRLSRSGKDLSPLRQETKNEIAGIMLVTIGVFLFLALVLHKDGVNLIGPVGSAAAGFLRLLLGNVVSFFVPCLIWLLAAGYFFGKKPQNIFLKLSGLIVFIISICSILSIPFVGKETLRESAIRYGGLVGNFFISQEGLKLGTFLGVLGAYLLFIGLMIVSLLLSTNFLFQQIFAAVGEKLEVRKEEKKKTPKEKVPRRTRDSRVFKRQAVEVEDTVENVEVRDNVFAKSDGKIPSLQKPASSGSPIIQARPSPKIVEEKEEELDLFADYQLPPISLLKSPPRVENRMSKEDLLNLSELLQKTLADYNIEAEVVKVTQGPVVTRFELQPAPGVKINRIVNLENDIAMVLRAQSVRILAPIPGKAAVGIEVPNQKVADVYLKELLSVKDFQDHPSFLAFGLGKTISGEPYICDLAVMPHLLIAGTTGSGKSVCLNAIIASILFRQAPDKVKLLLIDPKRVELSVYQAIPHLISPVVYEAKKAATALKWVVEEMEERYKILVSVNTRDINEYNKIFESGKIPPEALGKELHHLPRLVIIIDELADLMVIARNEVEEAITRLVQMARAVGIHLILATQRPSVNVITGVIKANFPCRIAFKVATKVDSRTILDMNGAEALIGRGDMLYVSTEHPKPVRLQGSYISPEEIRALADYIRDQQKARYEKQDFPTPAKTTATLPSFDETEIGEEIDDELYRQAVKLILQSRKASVSLLQRRLKIGFARAGRLMDMMYDAGIVGEFNGSKPRELIVDPEEYLAQMEREEAEKETF